MAETALLLVTTKIGIAVAAETLHYAKSAADPKWHEPFLGGWGLQSLSSVMELYTSLMCNGELWDKCHSFSYYHFCLFKQEKLVCNKAWELFLFLPTILILQYLCLVVLSYCSEITIMYFYIVIHVIMLKTSATCLTHVQ